MSFFFLKKNFFPYPRRIPKRSYQHKRTQSGATASGAEAEKSAGEATCPARQTLRGRSSICARGRPRWLELDLRARATAREDKLLRAAVGDKIGRQWTGIGLGNETCAAAGHGVELVGLQSSSVQLTCRAVPRLRAPSYTLPCISWSPPRPPTSS